MHKLLTILFLLATNSLVNGQSKYDDLQDKIFESIEAGSPDQTLSYLKLYGEWASETMDDCLLAKEAILKGEFYYSIDSINASTIFYKSAADFGLNCSTEGDSLITYACGYAAYNLFSKEMWSEAIITLNKGLPYAKKIKDKSFLADFYSNLGGNYFYLGDFNKSVSYFDSCLLVEKSLHDTLGMLKVYNNVGKLSLDHGRFNESIEYFEKALVLIENYDMDQNPKARILGNLGDAYLKNKEQTKALKMFEKSIEIALKNKDSLTYFSNLISLSTAYRQVTHLIESNRVLSIAEKLLPSINSRTGYCNFLIEKGIVLSQQNGFDQSKKYLLEAITVADELQSKIKKKNAIEILYSNARKSNNLVDAVKYMDELLIVSKELNLEESQKSILSLNARYQYEKNVLEIEGLKDKEMVNKLTIKQLNLQRIWILTLAGLLLSLLGGIFLLNKQRQKETLRNKEEKIKELQLSMNNIRKRIQDELDIKAIESVSSEVLELDKINQIIKTPLTDREYEILCEIEKGFTNQEIAQNLFLSVNTVKFHLKNIYEKLEVSNRVQALKFLNS